MTMIKGLRPLGSRFEPPRRLSLQPSLSSLSPTPQPPFSSPPHTTSSILLNTPQATMASPSSSDHSSPSSAVNTSQDERLPQPGYPPSFLPFTTSSLGNQSYPNKSSSSVQRQGQMAGVVEGRVDR
jgi:hypothetical protein